MKKFSIPFSPPSIGRKEIAAVQRVMKNNWLTSGPETIAFEQEFAAYIRNHPAETNKAPLQARAVVNCTAGLHLALMALRIPQSKKVLVSPYTFVSSISVILMSGLEFDFYDIGKTSLYPDINDFKKKAEQSHYAAVIFIQITGFVTEQYQELIDIARFYKLAIIEDTAHSFPAYNQHGFLGTMGDIGVYSFYANKTITTGEGGMIVSRDTELINTITLLRNNGINKNPWDRNKNNVALYDVEALGYKYNLTDMQSAIGRVQLKKAQKLQKKRLLLAQEYIRLLKNKSYITLPETSSQPYAHSWHIFCIQFVHPSITRDSFVQQLSNYGIQSSIHYRPIHMMSYYKKRYSFHDTDFPNALSRFASTLSLPLFTDMKLKDVQKVCEIIEKIVEK